MRTLVERLRGLTFYSIDPESGAGGGGVANPVAPEAPPDEPGTPQGQPQEDGFWGRFPNVPLEQRALLEPHLKQVQAYVTKQQQRYAPLKDYSDEQIVGLSKFASDFDSNPLGMWLTLAQSLQENGIIHEELDLESLAAFAQGQFDEDEEEPAPVQQMPGTPDPNDPVMREIEELKAWKEQREQAEAQQQQQRQQQSEDRLFAKKLDSMKTNLKEAGLPEGLYTDKDLTAFIVANGGNFEAAEQAILNIRTGLLKGFVEPKPEDEVEVANGGPKPRPKPAGRRAPRDAFEAASVGAEQFLRSNLRSEAQ